MSERAREPRGRLREEPSEPPAPRGAPRRVEVRLQGGLRARLQRALRCVFCREDVPARAGVACARPGCGVTYHRACWEELREAGGRCAALGCGSVEVRDLSRLRAWLRLLRLLLAGLLFPPRLVEVVRRHEAAPARTVFGAAWRSTRSVTDFWSRYWNKPLPWWLLPPLVAVGPLLLFLSMALTVLTPLIAFCLTAAMLLLRAVGRALRSELALLDRGVEVAPRTAPPKKA